MTRTRRRLALSLVLAACFASPAAAQTGEPTAGELAALTAHLAPSKGAALVLPVSALSAPAVRDAVGPIVVDPETGVAMEGFDPVGFFTEGKAMKGDETYTAEFNGARFQFVSAENRERFLSDPERYVPAYGGYCTQTLAMGALTPASPLHWTIHGDRLFLTRSAAATEAFRAERQRTLKPAERYWAEANEQFLLGANAAAHTQ